MLGGKTVIMAGVHLRGDLCRKPEPVAEGEKEKAPTIAINIGRYIQATFKHAESASY